MPDLVYVMDGETTVLSGRVRYHLHEGDEFSLVLDVGERRLHPTSASGLVVGAWGVCGFRGGVGGAWGAGASGDSHRLRSTRIISGCPRNPSGIPRLLNAQAKPVDMVLPQPYHARSLGGRLEVQRSPCVVRRAQRATI